MRALHVHSGNLYGGVEALLVTLARGRLRALLGRERFGSVACQAPWSQVAGSLRRRRPKDGPARALLLLLVRRGGGRNFSPEPFGIAFAEALHAGLPIVTTATGGALEIVTPDTGELAPPELGATMTEPARLALAREAGPRRARDLCNVEARMHELAEVLSGHAP